MSGHNKWSTIKRKKGALDAKRSKIFSRIVKEIMVAVKEGGPDPNGNPRLRVAIGNAKGVNMPKDNILRAINKAQGEGANFEEITFEGYGPGGVAIFVECLTDNHKRTVSDVRSYFTKRNGTLGTNGSLNFIFDRKGIFEIVVSKINLEELELDLIDAGAQDIDVESDSEMITITTSMEDFKKMSDKLESLKVEVENAQLKRIPNSTKEVDIGTARSILKLVDLFEEHDDVQDVYHNLEITDDLAKALEEE